MVKPPIIQVVGFQNSGKTTFVKKVLQELSQAGIRAATIKHHGHGGKPEVIENKDSTNHIQSGAFASLVEGAGRLLLQVENNEWTLEEKIALIKKVDPDVIVIEGHKTENYPKVVLVRNEEDLAFVQKLNNVLAYIFHDELSQMVESYSEKKVFLLNDDRVVKWLVQDILLRNINETC